MKVILNLAISDSCEMQSNVIEWLVRRTAFVFILGWLSDRNSKDEIQNETKCYDFHVFFSWEGWVLLKEIIYKCAYLYLFK